MTPQFTEEQIRKQAERLNIEESLDAYGYETVELEILHNAFGKLFEMNPKLAKEIIEQNLDFYLSPVEDDPGALTDFIEKADMPQEDEQ